MEISTGIRRRRAGVNGEASAIDTDGGGARGGNLADAAVAAAMRYRVGRPLIGSLMAELGMNGSSLNGLLAASIGFPPVVDIVAACAASPINVQF